MHTRSGYTMLELVCVLAILGVAVGWYLSQGAYKHGSTHTDYIQHQYQSWLHLAQARALLEPHQPMYLWIYKDNNDLETIALVTIQDGSPHTLESPYILPKELSVDINQVSSGPHLMPTGHCIRLADASSLTITSKKP